MTRVVFRRAAKTEFEEAVAWYAARRAGLGEEFIHEVEFAVAAAAEAPLRHPAVFGDVRRTVTRRFPYSIYFRTRGDLLVVLAVFHGRRNPLVWQRRA